MIISKLCTPYSRESGSRRGSGLRRTLCLLALVAFYAVGAKADVTINATNFPDANFRNWVLAQDYGADGKLIDSEIAAVRSINVSDKSIADLKGIEYFTALRVLACYSNQLTSLDVSKNTELRTLSCYSNQLTSLDVSGCTALTTLNCDNNQLTSLDVSKNTALKTLDCSDNQLKSLDVSKNAALTKLLCYDNQIRGAGMATLVNSLLTVWGGNFYVYNTDGTEGNEITTVQVKAAKAKGWDVWTSDEDDYPGVPGIAIDATNFPDENFRTYVSSECDTDKDTYLSDDEIAAVTKIAVTGRNITDLKGIEYFTVLTELWCIDNQLKSLDVSKNAALTGLFCFFNQLTSLDVSKNTALKTLNCDVNQLTALDLSKNTALKSLNCNNNQLTSLDVSKNAALTKLYCGGNKLTTLDVSKNTALTELECYNNQLTSLDVSKNTALTELYCYGNQIRGVGMATLIETLPTVTYGDFFVTDEFDGNRITTVQVAAAKAKHWNVKTSYALDYPGVDPGIAIDATNFPDEKFRTYVSSNCDTDKDTYLSDDEIAAVKEINVAWNSISSLKGIEYFTALKTLECSLNQLTTLDVSGCTALTGLGCGKNQLTSLDVSKNTALTTLWCEENLLTSLDVSKNTALTYLRCYNNQIRGAGMATLIENLPTVTSSDIYVYNTDGTDGNRITTVQVAAAKAKGWDVKTADGGNYPGVPVIAIDATNFPDENFRTYVSSNCDTDKDTYLSDDEIAAVTTIDVSRKSIASLKGIEYFTALAELWCDLNQLTSLDVSKNTALTFLNCEYNQLASLDVSKNTALTGLRCDNNPLTTLDVSKNTALKQLYCYGNLLTSLDVSGCTALTTLWCYINQLTTLDVSKNTALKELWCFDNQLTSLDVSKNTVLTELNCYNNQIQGAGMATLIENLPTVTSGNFYVYNTDGTDGNRITTVQVAAAKAKHWNVKTIWGDDYPGVDIPGDANGDGEVNAQDVDCLRDYILGLDPTPFSLESANLNGDGAVDIVDLTLLIEMLKD